MLGLLNNLLRPNGGIHGFILPGGLLEDGDWAFMTDVAWQDQDGVDWDAWQNTSDGS
jgi:hypothetical protein|tara:strand:+ start:846 stop:1016 length:171 start_codon:yes stop_codon:yes gene_type:complete